jgi:hypothetical protein
MFNSTTAKVIAGAIAAVCVTLIPFTPDNVDPVLGAIAAVTTALVNFFGGPPADGGSIPKGSDVLRGLPTAGLCLFVLLCFGCASVPPQFKDVATEAGARTAVMTACSLGHSYDGKVSAATAVVEICSKQEYAEPWIEITKQIAELVEAQRAGNPRPLKPEPVKPEPVPAPPPVPPSEPALAPKPNEA